MNNKEEKKIPAGRCGDKAAFSILIFSCHWTLIHFWYPKDGVAKELDFVKEPSTDPSRYHKRKPLQDWEKTAMKHSHSGTSEHT